MSDMMTGALTAQDLANTFDAFNCHEIGGMMRHSADDGVFYIMGGDQACGSIIEGRDVIARAFAAVWTAMPDAH